MTPASDAGSAAQGDQDTSGGKAPDAGRAAGGNVPGGPVPGSFAARHIGLDAAGRAHVREVLGLAPAESAIGRALPAQLRSGLPEGLPEAADEATVLADLRRLAARNRGPKPMIGMGYYGTHLPAVIQRGILENPSWYTAYTPYQAEISQGRLEALFTFQTMIRDLTGLEMANASLLDEATAAAEAMTLCHRAARGKRARFAVDCDLFGQTRAVLANRAEPLGIELVDFDPAADPVPADVAGVLVQYQGADGRLLALAPLAQAAHAVGALLAVAADPLALTLLEAPGTLGADIAIGSVQRFGLPLGLGGPHAAYMAVRKGLERQMPGRLVGLSRDADGGPAFRLALQTREQHIRRERATSNICTAQVLVAVMAAMYAVWHGPAGLTQIALAVHAKARALVAALTAAGLELREGPSFDTVAVHTPGRSAAVRGAAQGLGIDVWAAGPDWVYLSTDETTTEDDLRKAAQAFGADPALIDPAAWRPAGGPSAAGGAASDLAAWERRTPFLTHRVFTEFHSETAMMRYLHRLAARDYALDRGMIPLGSCTMKLNAAAVMAAVTWPEFGAPHPLADAGSAEGTRALARDLERWLAALTGYDAVTLQPNAGSQGELTGLLAIRRYQAARGEGGRDVCLVPASAHGTNAASAALAGLRVVTVQTDPGGNVSLEDLEAKLAANEGRVSALMLTYPSTHGVYEPGVAALCEAAHRAGAQVYIDGANFNALLGWARAGQFGGDVSHLNLHKTFAMPHGGGGPGIGPVAAKAHLAPYLPGARADGEAAGPLPVAAAELGSAMMLSVPWAYIRLMGAEGLAQASEGAVLAANYVARRLEGVIPVLYRGDGGWVAHECLLDLRPLGEETGVSVDDVAKRLIDYGFHAPTMSFPVAGTLMVEPTESEPLEELDRFCDALIGIVREAHRIGSPGSAWTMADNPLMRAPHTAAAVTAEEWDRAYTRREAAYPAGVSADKYWPPVARVDNTYGDRNLVLTWPDAMAPAGCR